MSTEIEIPPALAKIAAGRDFISTAELARATHRAKQTVRNSYSKTGEYFGIRPVKFGNKLLWPVIPTAILLTRGQT